jgi:hypothetical protein
MHQVHQCGRCCKGHCAAAAGIDGSQLHMASHTLDTCFTFHTPTTPSFTLYACSALHFASAVGATRCVRLLLDAGADPDLQDREGYTPLHMAAGYMQVRVRVCVQSNRQQQAMAAAPAAQARGTLDGSKVAAGPAAGAAAATACLPGSQLVSLAWTASSCQRNA